MAGVDFEAVLQISLFVLALFYVGVLCKQFGVSPIIGEMLMGILLGPNMANIVPFEQFFRMAGVFGVTLMIFESGMHLDFQTIKVVGGKATIVALLGTLLPIAAGIGVAIAFDPVNYSIWPVGLAVGVSLAPTSVGMALKMLGEAKQLGESYGQLIVTAAFLDDILSLVALTMLVEIGNAMAKGVSLSLWAVFQPLVLSIVFCGVGALLAYPMERKDQGWFKKYILCWVGFWPLIIPPVLKFVSTRIVKVRKAQEAFKEALTEPGASAERARRQSLGLVRSATQNISNAVSTAASTVSIRRGSDSSIEGVDVQMQDASNSPRKSPKSSPRKSPQASPARKASASGSPPPAILPDALLQSSSSAAPPSPTSPSTPPPSPPASAPALAAARARAPEASEAEYTRGETSQGDKSRNSSGHGGSFWQRHTPHFHRRSEMEKHSTLNNIFGGGFTSRHRAHHHHHLHMPHLHMPHLHMPHLSSHHGSSHNDHSGHGSSHNKESRHSHFHMPHLHAPSVHLPHLHAPSIHMPHLHKPSIHLPHIGPAHESYHVEALRHQEVVFDLQDRVLLTIMFLLLLAYGAAANYIGSHLLGAFIAGVSFCWMPHHAGLILWHSQVKRISSWLIRLFFGATVAFSIPIQQMLVPAAIWKGVLLGLGPCIGTKLIAGIFTGKDKWVVGFAMVGRGEFAYLVAQSASIMLLNPATTSFAAAVDANPGMMVHLASGGYCWNELGTCDDAAASSSGSGSGSAAPGRRLAGAAASAIAIWCKHCVGGVCDEAPMANVTYWMNDAECADHFGTCNCELMMPPSAFSITVWALLLASVFAPVGFGIVLRRRLKVGKTKDSNGKPSSSSSSNSSSSENTKATVSKQSCAAGAHDESASAATSAD
jgi:Kef-type K+ transport system membrane component KefB